MTAPGPGEVLFRFVRHWSRRPVAEDPGGQQGRLVLVCEAVHALHQRSAPATVNAVAGEIGMDQSGASRLIRTASSAGVLAMAASPTDGRAREASLTTAGRSLLEEAHRWQEDVFARLAAGWSEGQRRDFQHAMSDLMDRSYTLDS